MGLHPWGLLLGDRKLPDYYREYDYSKFKFQLGDQVLFTPEYATSIKQPGFETKVNFTGLVRACYISNPPMYEVRFPDLDGSYLYFAAYEFELCKADGMEPEPRESEGNPQSQSVDRG
jgi:hypothetical protein